MEIISMCTVLSLHVDMQHPGMCDANNAFTYAEIGSRGREDDAGVFLGSGLRSMLQLL